MSLICLLLLFTSTHARSATSLNVVESAIAELDYDSQYEFLNDLLSQVDRQSSWMKTTATPTIETGQCTLRLVESIPENLTYHSDLAVGHMSTFDAWNDLIESAQSSIYLASFYWSLVAKAEYQNMSAIEQGRKIFNALLDKASQVDLQIAQSGAKVANDELDRLKDEGAELHWVDVGRLLGRGIIHTKLWTVDNQHAYVGSANMDWRSLTEVKELGVLFRNCPTIVNDLNKIEKAYWLLSFDRLPSRWPSDLATQINREHPLSLSIGDQVHSIYFSRYFQVPSFTEDQRRLPYARVNHNKYMVTDNVAYVGTSNWSGDYFLYAGGIGVVVRKDDSTVDDGTMNIPASFPDQLLEIFERDWNSEYTLEV